MRDGLAQALANTGGERIGGQRRLEPAQGLDAALDADEVP
jgi:hypothetical protein